MDPVLGPPCLCDLCGGGTPHAVDAIGGSGFVVSQLLAHAASPVQIRIGRADLLRDLLCLAAVRRCAVQGHGRTLGTGVAGYLSLTLAG